MFNIEDYREYITPNTAVCVVADLVVAARHTRPTDKALLDEIMAWHDILKELQGDDAYFLVNKRLHQIDADQIALDWWDEYSSENAL